jgi:hypothetical protein
VNINSHADHVGDLLYNYLGIVSHGRDPTA